MFRECKVLREHRAPKEHRVLRARRARSVLKAPKARKERRAARAIRAIREPPEDRPLGKVFGLHLMLTSRTMPFLTMVRLTSVLRPI